MPGFQKMTSNLRPREHQRADHTGVGPTQSQRAGSIDDFGVQGPVVTVGQSRRSQACVSRSWIRVTVLAKRENDPASAAPGEGARRGGGVASAPP